MKNYIHHHIYRGTNSKEYGIILKFQDEVAELTQVIEERNREINNLKYDKERDMIINRKLNIELLNEKESIGRLLITNIFLLALIIVLLLIILGGN